MFFIVSVVVFFVGMGCWLSSNDTKSLIGVLLMLFSIVNGIWGGVYFDTHSKYVYVRQYPICALSDTTQIEGHGGMFSYYIKENDVYKYLAKYKDGKKMYSIPTDESYIVEKYNTNPRIEIYERKLDSKNWYFNFEGTDNEYKIVVPSGSVTNQFNVDLNK